MLNIANIIHQEANFDLLSRIPLKDMGAMFNNKPSINKADFTAGMKKLF